MAEKIQTKPFQHSKNEGSWPPLFGDRYDPETGEIKGKGHICYVKDGELHEGPPPRPEVHDRAPYVIQDSIEPYYHPGICRVVDTRSGLRDADNACGTITTDKLIPGNKNATLQRQKELKEDRTKALHKAVADVDSGNAPLSEETRAICKQQNEILAAALPGLDPWNAAGHRSDKRGKRYKK